MLKLATALGVLAIYSSLLLLPKPVVVTEQKLAPKPKHQFSGLASYYADCFHGRKTASGAMHDRTKLMAAHRTLPFGTKVRITNRINQHSCVVVINDRGPFISSRVIDVSHAAAQELGLLSSGSRMVDCSIIASR